MWAESVALEKIATCFGTPTYVYSKRAIEQQYDLLSSALAELPHEICYAVKANSNLGVLGVLADLGAGFDVVSGGELERVMRAGGEASKAVFSGVGKTIDEINFALKAGIACFNVESEAELERVEKQASLLHLPAPISLRVNPDIDPGTHPYISTGLKENKFGIPTAQAMTLYQRANASPHLRVLGIDCHIGSQISSGQPLIDALKHLLGMVDDLNALGIHLQHVDMGGGFAVRYGSHSAGSTNQATEQGSAGNPEKEEFELITYAKAVCALLAGRGLKLIIEPGRYLVANAGVLLTRVEYLKPSIDPQSHHGFAIVDAAMNDLIRPALYQAWHDVEVAAPGQGEAVSARWNLAGPICESSDVLAKDRQLALSPDALLAIKSAGAYGFVQSSNYNSRNRAAEVMVDDDRFYIIRKRETLSDQIALENRLPL